jgi:hypothetical protein
MGPILWPICDPHGPNIGLLPGISPLQVSQKVAVIFRLSHDPGGQDTARWIWSGNLTKNLTANVSDFAAENAAVLGSQ